MTAIDPEEVLNQILSNTCPNEIEDDEYTFSYDLHCAKVTLVAEKTGTEGEGEEYEYTKFRIISMRFS